MAGGNQFTMRATLEASPDQSGVWLLGVTRDDPVIDPVILAGSGPGDDEPFALNRAMARLRIDTVRKRIDLDQGDFSRIDTRPSHNIAVAVTGSLDYSGAEPHLAFGVACTRMPVSMMKRIWPVFAAGDVRNWVMTHVSAGTVERVVIAGNAPLTVDSVKYIVGQAVTDESKRDLKKADAMVQACFASKDYTEGRKAFMEKRKPQFTGT